MIDPTYNPSADAGVRALVQERRKIEAIKLVRQRTGLGLKEAKDLVDAMEIQMGLPVSGPGSGTGIFLAVAVLLLGLLAWWWLRT
jgi:hypothetical protein